MHRSLIRIRNQRRKQWETKYPWLDPEAIDIIIKNNRLTWYMCNFIKNRHWFEHHPTVTRFIQREDRHEQWSMFVNDIQTKIKDVPFEWKGILFG